MGYLSRFRTREPHVANIQTSSPVTITIQPLDRRTSPSMSSDEDKSSPWTKEKAAKFEEYAARDTLTPQFRDD
jgi:hypothetical protein